jgi:hypothetical protein
VPHQATEDDLQEFAQAGFRVTKVKISLAHRLVINNEARPLPEGRGRSAATAVALDGRNEEN